MSAQQNNDNVETLFSFELLVECVRLEKESKVSDELALGVRLLDFPTLLIYQPQRSSGSSTQRNHHGKCHRGEYVFNRGKSCFFKMNMNSLHVQLLNSPLYAMVLDVQEEIPKLVGTSLISLAKVMDRIRRDAATPSSHGERGVISVCNLLGEKIGSISLSYKLLSLGANALPLADSKSTSGHGEQYVQAQERVKERNVSTESMPPECGNVSSPTRDKINVRRNNENKPSNEKNLTHEDELDSDVCVAMQTGHKTRTQIPQTPKENEDGFEDLTMFCPPHLFYTNSAEGKSQTEGGDWKLLNPDYEAFIFEDTYSEEETSDVKIIMNQTVRPSVKRNQQRNGVTPDVFGEALQQLPLLNALLVELSQLSGQNPTRPLSVHPNLSWIYRPASPAPSVGHGDTTGKAPTNALQKARHVASPHLKHMHPRNCSTPVVGSSSVKVKEKEALIKSTSPRKKLTYGTTKTYNLRLQQLSSRGVKRHECMEQNETQTSMIKGKTKESNKIMKSSKRKSALSLNENIETTIQSITEDCVLQKTTTLKQKTQNEKIHSKKNRFPLRVSDKGSLSERDLKVIHIPRVDGDGVAKDKDKNECHSESNQSESQSDRHRDKIQSSGSSRQSSPRSSFSDASGEGEENADYTDDFNSLEPSDAYSPDPARSPEPSRARTPKSPAHPNFCNSDSGSEVFQRRAVLPQPIKASSSPQHSLRGTYIIQPRTHASAVSFSSDDSDGDGSASLRTACSRKQTEGGGVERISAADTLISSRGQSSESKKSSGPGQGSSEESVSSFEPQETEEMEEELGSLDFRKEYQHMSKLVASKLPGYTM